MAKTEGTEAAATAQTAKSDAKVAATPAAKFDFTKLNTLAVVSLASGISWVGAVAGVITGHIALAQIKKSGEQGRALAITGLVLGYLYIAGSIVFGLLMLLFRLRGWVTGDYSVGGYYNHQQMGPGMMGNWDNR